MWEPITVLRVVHDNLTTRIVQITYRGFVTYYVTNGVINFQAPFTGSFDALTWHLLGVLACGGTVIQGWE